jgi:tRNA (cmo5U34)-methyltransferase
VSNGSIGEGIHDVYRFASAAGALLTADIIARTFPVPDGVGGRYSVLSAVGLMPAALLGLDIEKGFKDHWLRRRAPNLKFKQCDVRTFDGMKKLSLVYSLFTLQFLPERDRLKLVKRIYNGLVEGGALILSEKVLAKNAKIQDMLAFTYYDFKRETFSASEILDKEKSIRDQMHLWSEYKLFEMLRSAGFKSINLQLFWRNHLFIGILAMKSAKYR